MLFQFYDGIILFAIILFVVSVKFVSGSSPVVCVSFGSLVVGSSSVSLCLSSKSFPCFHKIFLLISF